MEFHASQFMHMLRFQTKIKTFLLSVLFSCNFMLSIIIIIIIHLLFFVYLSILFFIF